MRPSRPARVFDADGHEVLVTLLCPRCGRTKPLSQFGLRRMDDGKIRNAPWCKACRGRPGMRVELVMDAARAGGGA